ncbi:MAG: glycosyltransferase [Chlamydiales bacterium]
MQGLGSYAVILKTHNSSKYIHKAIASLEQQTIKPKQIIIIDSASKDASDLNQYKNLTRYNLTIIEEDIGFCKGNNLGYRMVEPEIDFVLFLNPDAFPESHVIEQCLHYMNHYENHHIGAVTGALHRFDIDQNRPTGYIDSTGIFQTWYGRWYDRGQGDPITQQQQDPESVPALCGAFMFCRKQALDQVLIGGDQVFDESFFMYKEDIDLSLRMRREGWDLKLLPQLIVFHCRGWQRRALVPQKYKVLSARNECVIHWKKKSPTLLYSLLKYLAVRFLRV